MNQSFSKGNGSCLKAYFGAQKWSNDSFQNDVIDNVYYRVWPTSDSWTEPGSVEEQLQVITICQLFDAVWEGQSTQILPFL